jgi:4-amino-4-deoxychorismate lyase
MSPFANDLLFESIQIRDGIPQRLELHDERMNRSRKYFFASKFTTSLQKLIEVPEDMREGVVKCKVSYGESIGRIEFSRYIPRVHNGVAIVKADSDLEYDFKYSLRAEFEAMEALHPGKAVIISRAGAITDCTYANVALFDGVRWLTPKHYLLNGVMRQWLLSQGTVEEEEILVGDLTRFQSVKLINAMLEWDESPLLPLHSYLFH